MSKTKSSRRLSKFEIGIVLLFLAIGLWFIIVMGPTQLLCNRSANGVTCSLRQMSAFGLLQRVEAQVINLKTTSLDVQVQRTPRLNNEAQGTSEEVINYYGVKLVGESQFFLGRHTIDEQSQQEKVNQINQFIQNNRQNEFAMQSQDYRSNLFGVIIIVLTGIWLYVRLKARISSE